MINKQLRSKIGKELTNLLNSNASIQEISQWADSIYSNHCRELDTETDELLAKISFMQHGEEFLIEKSDLKLIASQLENING